MCNSNSYLKTKRWKTFDSWSTKVVSAIFNWIAASWMVPAHWVPPASNLKFCLRDASLTSDCPALPRPRIDVFKSQKMTKSLQVPICRLTGKVRTKTHFYGFRVYQDLATSAGL